MSDRVGVWLIGALGGVGTTVALGIAALKRGATSSVGLTTALPLFDGVPLHEPASFIVGGHDIRSATFSETVREFQERSNVFDPRITEPCLVDLKEWDKNIRPGTVLNAGETIHRLANLPGVQLAETPAAAILRIQQDLKAFRDTHRLDKLVVVNVSSTEPPFPLTDLHRSWNALQPALEAKAAILPASALYALAAIDLGVPYINFTPSLGASFPAALELLEQRKGVIAGKDGKTGETLLKTVLAPMFAHRNLQVLSWVGHNIFGNRDGLVLNDPKNKESKVKTKDEVVTQILGYKPQTHVSIEYIPSLDDWKTAWDHIHFQGFLGTKMIMQFIWQGCDSLLAAPLVIDLIRLTLLSQRNGETGILRHLACFFKSPMGIGDHDFFEQFDLLRDYVAALKLASPSK